MFRSGTSDKTLGSYAKESVLPISPLRKTFQREADTSQHLNKALASPVVFAVHGQYEILPFLKKRL